MGDFVHLHVHTEYDLLRSPNRIDDLVKKANDLGMKALACTDRNTMYGTIPFYQACRRQGIQPILGLEVELIHDEAMQMKDPPVFTLVLLAESYEGYENLMRISSHMNIQLIQHRPLLPFSRLAQHHQGLIALSGGIHGEVASVLLNGGISQGKAVAQRYLQLFGAEHFFLELQDHGLEEEKLINQYLVTLHQELGIPLVVTNDVYYLQQEDAVLATILEAIEKGEPLEENGEARSNLYYLKNEEEMVQQFSAFPQALANTARIAQRCHIEIPMNQMILPAYPLPTSSQSSGKSWSAAEYLRLLCEKGVQERYGTVTPLIQQRLEHELTIIEKMGFADYFLIVWDFMRYAHEQRIMTGPGRGSAAGSLVAYVLRITDIDPLEHQLLFERFLNPERISMPDIDIDFSDRRRDEMIRYVVQKYGKEHVAQIVTFGTMAARAAIRDVGRVLNYPKEVIDGVAKLIPQSPGMTLAQALQDEPRLEQLFNHNLQVTKLIQLAQKVEGLPRHTSTHAAGVVISREPLLIHVPLQLGSDEHWLTQYPMNVLEVLGLLKMDFLGLRNLSLIEEILAQVEEHEGIALQLDHLPFDDASTYELLAKGDTTGIFQLESEGMRHVLRELRPNSFEDIVAVLALYRPGPMENIPIFIKAKHGELPIQYPHPDLEGILSSTYGIIVYQEQIMQIASTMAGFSLGEADLLRRAVSKKKREILDREREHFVRGCIGKGYDDALAHEVYDLIVRFADYGFNRSHSAAYAMLAYRLAYLKANYPGIFMASLLSQSMGNQNKLAEYVEEAKRMGFGILPPDVNRSQLHFTYEQGKIQVGLASTKNVGTLALHEIITKRKVEAFRDLADFCQRVDLRLCNRRVMESLIMSGAMDIFPGHRAQMLAILDQVMEMGQQYQRKKAEKQLHFFAEGEAEEEEIQYPELPPFTLLEKLHYEKELLGFYVSGHPLDEWISLMETPPLLSLEQVARVKAGTKVTTLGLITDVKPIRTRKGERMAFANVEGRFSTMQLVLFPDSYSKNQQFCERNRIVVIAGKVEQSEENSKIVVEQLYEPQQVLNQLKRRRSQGMDEAQLFIRIPAAENEGVLLTLQERLLQHPGSIPVYLHYESTKKTRKLSYKYNCSGSTELLTTIEQLLGKNSVILKKTI